MMARESLRLAGSDDSEKRNSDDYARRNLQLLVMSAYCLQCSCIFKVSWHTHRFTFRPLRRVLRRFELKAEWPINQCFISAGWIFCVRCALHDQHHSKSLKNLNNPQRNRNEKYFIETSVEIYLLTTLIIILSYNIDFYHLYLTSIILSIYIYKI